MSAARDRHGASRGSRRPPGARGEWSLEPGDTAAVPRVRHWIMDVIRQDAPRDADLWSAELVVAELLSNAVTHAGGPAFVSLEWDGEHPLLSVADLGPGFTGPMPPPGSTGSTGSTTINSAAGQALPLPWRAELPADLLAEGGRGLYLVSHLALGVEFASGTHGGAQVSVTLDVARSA
jgi:signal transduction histidine kinase